jgi:hypothetical protein
MLAHVDAKSQRCLYCRMARPVPTDGPPATRKRQNAIEQVILSLLNSPTLNTSEFSKGLLTAGSLLGWHDRENPQPEIEEKEAE